CWASPREPCACASAAAGPPFAPPTGARRTPMHPDDLQLATYLDLPSDAPGYQELRAHVLTCSRCAARLALLREDSRRIPAALAGTGDTPDVRAAVRARL